MIAENMLAQIDSNSFSATLMEGIVDFKKDEAVAVPKNEKYVVTCLGQR